MRKGQFAAVPTEDDNGTDGYLSGHRLSSASVTQLEMAGTTPTTASYSTQRIVHAWVQPEPLERVILRRAMKVLVIFSLLCFLASKLLAGTHSPPMKREIADAYRTAMGMPRSRLLASNLQWRRDFARLWHQVHPQGQRAELDRTRDRDAARGHLRGKLKPRRRQTTMWRNVRYFKQETGVLLPSGSTGGMAPCRHARVGDTVSLEYTSWTLDRGVRGPVVDTSTGPNGERGFDPYTFKLGSGQAMQGLDLSVRGMCVKETRLVVVPPMMAYGHHPLLFSVEMIAVKRREQENGEDAVDQSQGRQGTGEGQVQEGDGEPAERDNDNDNGSSAHQRGGQLFCKEAPPHLCSMLNRSPCYMRQNTCGPCLSRHRGQMGYANTKCHAVQSQSQAVDGRDNAHARAEDSPAGADADNGSIKP